MEVEQLREGHHCEQMLRSRNEQAGLREVEMTGLARVKGFHRGLGRRWQMRQRIERLQRALGPQPMTLGCVLGAPGALEGLLPMAWQNEWSSGWPYLKYKGEK